MECDSNIQAELGLIPMDSLFQTEATLLTYASVQDPYGGRRDTWVEQAGVVMVSLAQDRPGQISNVGARKEPRTAPYVIHYPRSMTIRVRDRWRIGDWDYEVEEVQDTAQWDFFNTAYCGKVDQYEPA